MILDQKKIQVAIATMGLGVTEFCKQANLSPNTYQKIGRCKKCQTRTAGKIAKTLGVTVEDLIKKE